MTIKYFKNSGVKLSVLVHTYRAYQAPCRTFPRTVTPKQLCSVRERVSTETLIKTNSKLALAKICP